MLTLIFLLLTHCCCCCCPLPVWPGSHARIWEKQWEALEQRGELHTHSRRGLTEKSDWFGGFGQILRDTPAVETSAPSGSVVLWHTKILHMRGHNTKKSDSSQDTIRQATIYSFIKTTDALPDARLMTREGGDMWRDWSAEVRGTATAAAAPSPLAAAKL